MGNGMSGDWDLERRRKTCSFYCYFCPIYVCTCRLAGGGKVRDGVGGGGLALAFSRSVPFSRLLCLCSSLFSRNRRE